MLINLLVPLAVAKVSVTHVAGWNVMACSISFPENAAINTNNSCWVVRMVVAMTHFVVTSIVVAIPIVPMNSPIASGLDRAPRWNPVPIPFDKMIPAAGATVTCVPQVHLQPIGKAPLLAHWSGVACISMHKVPLQEIPPCVKTIEVMSPDHKISGGLEIAVIAMPAIPM